MPNESLIRCEVYCQKGRQYSAATGRQDNSGTFIYYSKI